MGGSNYMWYVEENVESLQNQTDLLEGSQLLYTKYRGEEKGEKPHNGEMELHVHPTYTRIDRTV